MRAACFPFTLLVLAALGCSAGSDYSFAVAEQRCVAATVAEKNWLPPSWRPFANFVRTCTVRDSKGTAHVLVLSVSAPEYYRSLPGRRADQVTLPRALLFLPNGSECGELPYAFPDDPPVELQVAFHDWRSGFPLRIEIAVTDPTVSGNRKLIQNWDPKRRRYFAGEGGSKNE
ncbi:MAG: hypothetical protein JNL98_05775 [Bryobacterales bacterium]|nr:hypothetical protein [Bryobacterales bacterium]